jgi:hypothetical protein
MSTKREEDARRTSGDKSSHGESENGAHPERVL